MDTPLGLQFNAARKNICPKYSLLTLRIERINTKQSKQISDQESEPRT